jgi:hypothetical protein
VCRWTVLGKGLLSRGAYNFVAFVNWDMWEKGLLQSGYTKQAQ